MRKRLVGAVLSLAVSTAFSASALADELVIGTAAPLSGPQAYFGVTWQNGMLLYLEEVNAKGGVKGSTLSLQQMDDKADPREGTLVAQKLCDGDAVVFIGHFNSGVALPALPIYEECDLGDIVMASNPAIAQQGFTNMVRPIANDFAQGGLPAQYAVETLKAKKAAVVSDKQAFGQGVAEIFEAEFKELGGEVTSVSAVNPTDVDFTALITQLKAEAPDVVYLGAVMPQLALFAKQMREQGLEARLIVPDGGYTPDLIAQAGPEAAEGVLISFQVPPSDATPALAAFAKAYKARFKEEVGAYSVYGYVMAQIAVEAINQAASPTREDVLAALKSLKMDSLVGPVEFDETGEIKVAPIFLYEVQGDKFALVAHSG